MKSASERFTAALLKVDKPGAGRILRERPPDTDLVEWLEAVVSPALEEIGSAWDRGDLALAQVYTAGRICEDTVDALMPTPADAPGAQARTAIVVLQDFHMLGKRIVHSVVRASGIPILDYGRMEADELVRRATDDGIQVLLISTLMLPAALAIKGVGQRLGEDVKIIVGGAPFRLDDQLWKEVGADAMGRNSADAIHVLRQLLGDTA